MTTSQKQQAVTSQFKTIISKIQAGEPFRIKSEPGSMIYKYFTSLHLKGQTRSIRMSGVGCVEDWCFDPHCLVQSFGVTRLKVFAIVMGTPARIYIPYTEIEFI